MPPLADGHVEVWRADLSPWFCDHGVLSAEERARAARFRLGADRARWIKGRSLLRLMLGRYLDADPRRVRIELGVNGKPEVQGSPVAFNLAHSGDLALYAFASGSAIGIDVELLGRELDVPATAERALGLEEAQRLRALPAPARRPEFLKSWVRYEAALKCGGGRLGLPVAYDRLSLLDIDLAPHAVGALATGGPIDDLRLLEWDRPGRERPGRTSPPSAAQLEAASGAGGQPVR
jgi:4'-phosphopantetheinyl transferase